MSVNPRAVPATGPDPARAEMTVLIKVNSERPPPESPA